MCAHIFLLYSLKHGIISDDLLIFILLFLDFYLIVGKVSIMKYYGGLGLQL